MIKILPLTNVPKEKREPIQFLADSCIANEEHLNTGKICWFISENFYRENRKARVLFFETKKDGISGVALLHPHKKNGLLLSHFYVTRKFRRKGIGTKILKRAIKIAKTEHKLLSLKVNPRNKTALKLYADLGFIFDPDQSINMTLNA